MFLKRLLKDPINRNYVYAFFKDFAFFSAVLVPFFTNWGGISQFQVQLIQSWFSFWVFILEVPTGAVADKIGRKHSIALGSLVIALAVLLYGSFPRFELFLVAEFMFAVGYALTSGADQALLYDTLKEQGRENESKKILGRADSFHMLGIMAAAPIGSIIAAKFGINAPMIASAVPFFIAAIVGWSIREPKIHSEGSESPKYLEIVKTGFRTIRRNTIVRTLAVDSVLVAAAAYFVVWLYQPLLESLHVPLQYFGLGHFVLLGSEIMVASNFALLERVLGAGKNYIRNSALLVAVVIIMTGIFPSLATTMLFLVIAGGIGFTRATYITSIANKYISSRERATVLSSIGMLRRFSLVLLNPFMGWIADYSLPIALVAIGILPLFTLLIKEEIE